jgi:thioredoxin-related protein
MQNPKKLYIDIYTEWCGWCKKMDKSTFTDPDIVELLNSEYYPIKFDAEQSQTIQFNGHEFIYRPNGKRGVHELAISLTNSQLTYPSFVMLDETFARILISPGYKDAEGVLKELRFGIDEAYKYSSFEDYKPSDSTKVD